MVKENDDKLLKFLMKYGKEQKKSEEIHGSARGLLGTDFFETSPEEKAHKKQRKFEKNTFENFKVIHAETLEILNTLREFYAHAKGSLIEEELIDKERLRKILDESETLINEVVEREQKLIDKLKTRLIDAIKDYANEKKWYERKRKMYEKWVRRTIKIHDDCVDLIHKYEREIIENNRLTRLLTEKVIEYNEKIQNLNEGR